MNKKAASELLGVSVRLVERYAGEGRLGEVRYVRGKTGKVADYAPEAVERLKAELESVDTQLVQAPNTRATGLVVASQSAALVALVEALRGSVDSSPVWLTREQALEASGVPVSWFDVAVRAGKLPHIGEGRGRRYHREDVRRYAESLRADGMKGELPG